MTRKGHQNQGDFEILGSLRRYFLARKTRIFHFIEVFLNGLFHSNSVYQLIYYHQSTTVIQIYRFRDHFLKRSFHPNQAYQLIYYHESTTYIQIYIKIPPKSLKSKTSQRLRKNNPNHSELTESTPNYSILAEHSCKQLNLRKVRRLLQGNALGQIS